MVEVYDSHEQSERVKGWLRENGSAIVMGLVLAFGGLFGFKQWQIWEQSKAQQASAEYATMVELLADDRLDDAVANYETLKTDFNGTAYATLAALHMAKARVESGQSDLATSLLKDALKHAEPPPVKNIIQERLARLYLDQGESGLALETLNQVASDKGFEGRFAEIRGDIHRANGDVEAARSSYNEALELNEAGIGYRPMLEMKLEALGPVEAES